MSKAKNFATELKNPRTRMIFFGSLALIVLIIAVAWRILGSSSEAEAVLASQVAAPPQIAATSGMVDGTPNVATDEYDRLLAQDNQLAAENARGTGGSAIPIPRTGVAESTLTMQPRDLTAPPPPVTSSAPTRQNSTTEGDAQRQAHEAAVQARVAAMQQQLSRVESYWGIEPHRRYAITVNQAVQGGVSGAQAAGSGAASAAMELEPVVEISMGDLLYATLDFGVNTDDPQSANFVQATIQQPGPFNQAVVLGSLEEGDQYSKTVGIHFTQMKVPGEARPRQIDAWAVDPSTERPSLASDVDNHYLSRGVSLFIGSFMDGYSQGLLQGGRQQRVVAGANGALVVQQDAYSSSQLAQIGIGNVGKNMSQVFAQSATRKRTITVDKGTDLGVWFLKDVPAQ